MNSPKRISSRVWQIYPLDLPIYLYCRLKVDLYRRFSRNSLLLPTYSRYTGTNSSQVHFTEER